MADDSGIYAAYLALGVQALLPIFLGSFKSLKTPESTLARRRKHASLSAQLPLDDEAEDDDFLDETLSWKDSLVFPVFGSVALLGLWALLKYVGKEWINLFLGVYFSGAGMFAFQSTLSSVLSFVIRWTSYKPETYHIRISAGVKEFYHLPISLPSLLLLPVSIALPALYLPLGRPYVLSNVLALCLATASLALLRLDSFFTAFLLLGALLVYDIFWVFATPVMVTVAKGIDAPIKILASKNPFSTSKATDFAMLGLGDIVVPGLVIALCLRFDLAQYAKRHSHKDITASSSFSKPYFWVSIASYIVGLGTTMGVMHYTRRAQPALLYLSPTCTLGPVILALIRGELKALWAWSDAPDDKNKVRSKVDDTIEAGSEVARKARQAVQEDRAEEVAAQVVQRVEAETGTAGDDGANIGEDDAWMEGTVGVLEQDGKARRRRAGKRK